MWRGSFPFLRCTTHPLPEATHERCFNSQYPVANRYIAKKAERENPAVGRFARLMVFVCTISIAAQASRLSCCTATAA